MLRCSHWEAGECVNFIEFEKTGACSELYFIVETHYNMTNGRAGTGSQSDRGFRNLATGSKRFHRLSNRIR